MSHDSQVSIMVITNTTYQQRIKQFNGHHKCQLLRKDKIIGQGRTILGFLSVGNVFEFKIKDKFCF